MSAGAGSDVFRVRPATSTSAAFRTGADEAFMRSAAAELVITPQHNRDPEVLVADGDGAVDRA